MPAPSTLDLMFDGELKTCTLEDDRNGELLYVADDGRFVKFPSEETLDADVQAYNAANDKEVEVIPEVVYGSVTTFDKDGNPVE